jgi:hypothetical protein
VLPYSPSISASRASSAKIRRSRVWSDAMRTSFPRLIGQPRTARQRAARMLAADHTHASDVPQPTHSRQLTGRPPRHARHPSVVLAHRASRDGCRAAQLAKRPERSGRVDYHRDGLIAYSGGSTAPLSV